MSRNPVSKAILSCVVAVSVSAGAGSLFAQNKGGDSAQLQQMMKQRQEAAKDPAQVKMMQGETMRSMVMEHMAHQMATDPEFQKMHAEMMKDPACMTMMEGCKTMMKDETAMAKVHDEIMKDPKAMDMVMNKAMMMDMAKTDPDMMKMMGTEKMDMGGMDMNKMKH